MHEIYISGPRCTQDDAEETWVQIILGNFAKLKHPSVTVSEVPLCCSGKPRV